MKQLLLICAVVALVGCGKKPAADPKAEANSSEPAPQSKAEEPTEAEMKHLSKTIADAEAGDVVQQIWLGEVYASGYRVEKDEKEAVKWFRKAAD